MVSSKLWFEKKQMFFQLITTFLFSQKLLTIAYHFLSSLLNSSPIFSKLLKNRFWTWGLFLQTVDQNTLIPWCIFVWTRTHTHILYLTIYIYIYIYMYTHTDTHTHIYIYIYIHMYIYIYIQLYTKNVETVQYTKIRYKHNMQKRARSRNPRKRHFAGLARGNSGTKYNAMSVVI